jgi:redox-sensitive bicupin YhaK (pirin superfamily)
MAEIDLRRAAQRFHTDLGWLDSWHSFSFSSHYDPGNTHHGLLLVSNDDTVAPGAGFPTHAHRDMEIVTWVLSGELEHTDTLGSHGVIRPGFAQRMSAGTGIRHSEMNASATLPVHFVQMWVMPDSQGVAPSYEQVDVSDQLESGQLVAVASGLPGRAAVTIHQANATLWAARLPAGGEVEVPAAGHVHLFVARGSAVLDGAGDLVEGDAVRLTDAGALALTSRSDATEILLWEMG